MDKPISVGDLVIVVRPRKCGCGMPGTVYWVDDLRPSPTGSVKCVTCQEIHQADGILAWNSGRAAPLWRLKRIPPLADLKGKKDAADKPITLDGEIERLRKMVSA